MNDRMTNTKSTPPGKYNHPRRPGRGIGRRLVGVVLDRLIVARVASETNRGEAIA
jgi:hypothetical protein